ncbi:MAG: preprotein translocase subunit SecA [Gammaproteobacteria bacterium]|nr:preprotein translocase subunit SecA [Gammaproteobacteria bacterium]
MLGNLVRKFFGSRNDRMVKRLRKTVEEINDLESNLAALSDGELRAKTDAFRLRYQQGESLDQLLPEAFAVAREAGKRVLKMRHFDVQLIGAIVMHSGKISEMRTGEGKTLVATLAAYLNALSGKGVHVVTVNDYLARRDAEWMSKLYNFLGLTVGVVVAGMGREAKQQAYAADITYGTNNEFGFDYLRDNMAFSLADRVQRELVFAIIDEVDSILIDEARTPLIISGPTNDNSDLYVKINKLIPRLKRQMEENGVGDFSVDEKSRQAHLTEEGHDHVEELLVQHGILEEGDSLYDPRNINLMHHVDSSLRAHFLYQRDVHYVVENNEIVIVDEFTGRKMTGRRWSEGLHQAVEAKESVKVQNENQTLASITFQNYFRLYTKLAGMTGTADTEAYEFQEIYGLEVVVIPTHRPMVRDDRVDQIYLTQDGKYKAIIDDIQECLKVERPVLVGTASIESSEYLSKLLTKTGIPHEVLNAKQHAREADIVAQAGRPAALTIATNMAGRGTDIVLGGNAEVEIAKLENPSDADIAAIRAEYQVRHAAVIAAGGLHIIGTERHESRRIDNQLRGRAGRQGDPGSSRFYISLEDNLMRIFGANLANMMQRIGMKEDEAIEHPWVSSSIERAQRKVEAHNFDVRKHVLEYDDVANDQRKVIYDQRSAILRSEDVSETIEAIRHDVIDNTLNRYISLQSLPEQWDVEALEHTLTTEFGQPLPVKQWIGEDQQLDAGRLQERIKAQLHDAYHAKASSAGSVNGEATMRKVEKFFLLQVLDHHWKEHLATMDYLRQSIGLRGYAQKNPKQEYKRESFELFARLLDAIKYEVVKVLYYVQLSQEPVLDEIARREEPRDLQFNHPAAENVLKAPVEEPAALAEKQPYVREQKKLGRNDPCFCGSGKKYKQCHGRLES